MKSTLDMQVPRPCGTASRPPNSRGAAAAGSRPGTTSPKHKLLFCFLFIGLFVFTQNQPFVDWTNREEGLVWWLWGALEADILPPRLPHRRLRTDRQPGSLISFIREQIPLSLVQASCSPDERHVLHVDRGDVHQLAAPHLGDAT